MKIFTSFKNDLFRKELASVKILMFLIYGGQATLYPYFTVHLKSLGVSIEQTSIIFAVQPIIALLVAPMIGMVADRIGNFKAIFCFFLTFSAVASNLLLLVPSITEPSLIFQAICDYEDNYVSTRIYLQKVACENPDTIQDINNFTLNMKLLECESLCVSSNQEPSAKLLKEEDSDLEQCNETECYKLKSGASFVVFVSTLRSDYNRSIINIDHVEHDEDCFHTLSTCQPLNAYCNTSCTFKSNAPSEFCPADENNSDFGMTFWTYLGIRMIVTLGIGLVNGLFDAASMAIVQKYRGDIGYQRFWATISMCIFAPISGLLVDNFDKNFTPCFVLYAVLYIIAAITSLFLDLSMKLPSEDAFANLLKLLTNPEVSLMLVNIAALGICWGFLENFLFWFLENELHASNLLMGLTVTVGSGTGLFMTLISTWFTKKIGYVNVMVLAFAAYTVRYVGYSKAQTAYECLIFEMMENFTVTLLTVGVTLYCADLASMKMLTTMMTLWNGLHVISGRAFGSLLGGFLMARVGTRKTFMYFAYGSAAFGVFYGLINIFWIIGRRKRRQRSSTSDKSRGSGRSKDSDDEEEDEAYAQAMRSTTMQCSADSSVLITYVSDKPGVQTRRRAMSLVGPREIRNSFRNLRIIPRYAKSFSCTRNESLPTVFEVSNETDFVSGQYLNSWLPTEITEADTEVTRF